MIDYYIQNTSNEGNKVKLFPITGDITKPSFGAIASGNPRFDDAVSLVKNCSTLVKGKVSLTTPPIILLVFRGVATGGLQRGLGGFSAKPLTVKAKSIDPTLLSGDFKILSGLVPIQTTLSKDNKEGSIIAGAGQSAYKIIKVDNSVGNTTSYLCCVGRTLSWESTATPAGKMLCTFLGDTMNAYLADWDLVLVGIGKQAIKNDQTISNYKVINQYTDQYKFGSIPQWLSDGICNQTVPISNHVTQHGPESLYCQNPINSSSEEFIIFYGDINNVNSKVISYAASYLGSSPFDKLKSCLSTPDFQSYFLYQFPQFDGTGETAPPQNAIDNLNALIASLNK